MAAANRSAAPAANNPVLALVLDVAVDIAVVALSVVSLSLLFETRLTAILSDVVAVVEATTTVSKKFVV